jgi:hypothetical protein
MGRAATVHPSHLFTILLPQQRDQLCGVMSSFAGGATGGSTGGGAGAIVGGW